MNEGFMPSFCFVLLYLLLAGIAGWSAGCYQGPVFCFFSGSK